MDVVLQSGSKFFFYSRKVKIFLNMINQSRLLFQVVHTSKAKGEILGIFEINAGLTPTTLLYLKISTEAKLLHTLITQILEKPRIYDLN